MTQVLSPLDSTRHYRALFEVCGVGLGQAETATGRIVQVNPCLAEMLGRPASEIIGRSFLDFTHPDDRHANWALQESLLRGELSDYEMEKRLLRGDGTPVWVLIQASAVPGNDGRPSHTVVAVMDISARKRTEDELAESQQRLQLALDASELGLWEWDIGSGSLSGSPRMLSITGLGADDLAMDPLAMRRQVHPEDMEAVWGLEEAAHAGRSYHAEYRIVRRDGSVRWVANHARTDCDANGRPRRMIGTLADITERKQADTALHEARDELEARVHDRTEALAQANTALGNEVTERRATESQVRELLGQLVVAEEDERRRMARELHDTVGQHLTAITLALKAMESHPDMPAELRNRLAQLQRAARHLDDDIDRLSQELRPAALDDLGLDEALRQHALAWSEDTGVAIDVHTHGLRGRRFGQALESTVYRVVQEALTNVRKHAEAKRVGVIVEQRDLELKAIVEDDGRGFDAQIAPEGPPGNSHRRRLGLRGMNERALLAGGRLEIESKPGQGTTVYLTVPLQED